MSEKKHAILEEFLDLSKIFITAIIIAIAANTYIISNAEVPTGSMETAVMTGDRIIINRLAYKFDSPKRGDIVNFILPDDGKTRYLKRIIGLPGETVEGKNGIVYINGEALTPDFTDAVIDSDFGPYSVPDDCYFMMGDNRNNSWDSRYWTKKYVPFDSIIGRAELSYYPHPRMLE